MYVQDIMRFLQGHIKISNSLICVNAALAFSIRQFISMVSLAIKYVAQIRDGDYFFDSLEYLGFADHHKFSLIQIHHSLLISTTIFSILRKC